MKRLLLDILIAATIMWVALMQLSRIIQPEFGYWILTVLVVLLTVSVSLRAFGYKRKHTRLQRGFEVTMASKDQLKGPD